MSANNSVHLIGRLTRDIELRKTNSGKSVTQFTLAVYRDQEHSDFINCVAWNKLAELLYNKFHKGDEFAVEGHLQTRTYDKNGIKQFITEMFVETMAFTHGNKTANTSKTSNTAQAYSFEPQVNEFEQGGLDISNEDLPF